MPDVDENDWQVIESIDQTRYTITYPWHFVSVITRDYARLYLKAEGSWSCLGSAIEPCGANGHATLALTVDRLLLPTCAPGALIGKLGGSIAGRDDGVVFAISSRCFVTLPKKEETALYIGVNGATPSESHELARIKLEVLASSAT